MGKKPDWQTVLRNANEAALRDGVRRHVIRIPWGWVYGTHDVIRVYRSLQVWL